MSVILTKTNMVVAHEPEPGDRFIQVVWFGPPEDGKHRRVFAGPAWPADQYQSSVDWAVSMADFMVYPIFVTPIDPRELSTKEMVQ